jgi:hypothetical protein
MVKSSSPATAIVPPTVRNLFSGRSRALVVAAVVFTVSVLVAADDEVTSTVLAIEHVGTFVAPVGLVVTLHAMLTLPVNPPAGVTEIVDVFPVVAPGVAMVIGPLLLRAMPSAGFTVIGRFNGALVTPSCVAVIWAV